MKKRMSIAWVMLAGMLLVCSGVNYAIETRAFSRAAVTPSASDGVYVDVNFVNNLFFGGFDGVTYYPDVSICGKMASGFGFGAAVGYRWNCMAIEIGLIRTTHNYTFVSLPDDTAITYTMNITWKWFFTNRSDVQPYFNLDIGGFGVYFKNGAINYQKGEGEFDGYSLGGGLGIAYMLMPTLSIHANVTGRLLFITDVSNEFEQQYYKVTPPFVSLNLSLSGGMSFTF